MKKPIAWAALVIATACSTSAVVPRSKTTDDAWLGFARCLRSHGINVTDPVFKDDGGVEIAPADKRNLAPRAQFDRAVDTCRPILTAAGLRPPGERPQDDIALEDRALAFAKCARRAGYDVPDPVVVGDQVTNWDPATLGIDLEDPTVQRDADGCARQAGFDPRKE